MRNDGAPKNEIQDSLEEYLGRRKARVLAEELQKKINTETRHMHKDKVFFVSKNEKGELVPSRESKIKDSVKEILRKNLENQEEVEECFKHIMKNTLLTEVRTTRGFETIYVDGSSFFYDEQLCYASRSSFVDDDKVKKFQDDLRIAIKAKVKSFEVPVCDMSINKYGEPCFIPGQKPATNLSFNEIKQLAKENNLKLGNKNQYILFLATMIERIKIEMNITQGEAMDMVCQYPYKIGKYRVDEDKLELTGSRRVAGKCDISNVKKIFAFDSQYSSAGIAGICFEEHGSHDPLAKITVENDGDKKIYSGVGWFVFQ